MGQFFDIIKIFLTDVLNAFYQPFWFALTLAVLFTMVYGSYPSLKEAVKKWWKRFRTDASFRRMFLFAFCLALILFRTLYGRGVQKNPLEDVVGSFDLNIENGESAMESIENILLFIPFSFAFQLAFKNRLRNERAGFLRTAWLSAKASFLTSFAIEMLQLIFRVGTWQLSDLFFNTLGGLTGGFMFWCVYRLRRLFGRLYGKVRGRKI